MNLKTPLTLRSGLDVFDADDNYVHFELIDALHVIVQLANELHELKLQRGLAREYDTGMNEQERAPDGDDYNNLGQLLGIWSRHEDSIIEAALPP